MSGRSSVTPAARLTRGLLVAATATFLASASHAIAGGSVALAPVVLAMTLGTLVCVMLAGSRLTLPRVVLGVAVSQMIFHSLFTLFASGGSLPAGSGAGHSHALIASPPVAGTAMGGGDQLGSVMALSHVAAGLITIALVRYGESLWWALVGILTSSLSAMWERVDSYPVSDLVGSLPTRPASLGMDDLLHADRQRLLRGPPQDALTLT